MVSLDDFNLVELVFGESGSTLELIFAASALIGGVLFLFWFLLMLVGGVGEGLFEGLFGIEFDTSQDSNSYTYPRIPIHNSQTPNRYLPDPPSSIGIPKTYQRSK